jgi:general L-amino acid transport system substrate-binding protein
MGNHPSQPAEFALLYADQPREAVDMDKSRTGTSPGGHMIGTITVLVALTVAQFGTGIAGQRQGRLPRIRQRGALVCGVAPGVAGFASVDEHGRYSGFDVDICRALSAAIFGAPEKVRYQQASSVDEFLRSPDVDVVSRRLTWSLRREGLGLLFGPVMFYDGQGFLVPAKRGAQTVRQLSGARVCVVPGSSSESTLTMYFRSHSLTIRKVLLGPAKPLDGRFVEEAFVTGRCDAFTADVSELGSLRSGMAQPAEFRILSEQISSEPLAQVVRQGDADLFTVLRWTIFAMINAEELGVTSANLSEMAARNDPDVKRLLGLTPGNGRALGVDEAWAINVIKAVGNYGEAFDRNVGMRSPIKLERGLNRLWTAGGLMFAPSLR